MASKRQCLRAFTNLSSPWQPAARQDVPAKRLFWRARGRTAGGAMVLGAAAVSCNLEPKPNEDALPRSYDAEQLQAYCRQRPWATGARCMQVAREFVPFTSRLVRDWRSGQLRTDAVCLEHAARAREMLMRLGPAFIKAGQALSMRPDLLPDCALKELQRLCDDCEPVPWSVAQSTLEEELGQAVEEVFDLGDDQPQPVAAASLGQVYRWRRRAGGALVAVKVQRPDMLHSVALDIYILRHLARCVRYLIRCITNNRTDHVMLVDAWAKGTYSELDYVAESGNQQYFKQALGLRIGSRVYVPEVHTDITSRRVLVTEWVNGPRLADCSVDVVRDLVPVGVECFLAQLLDIGVFHSDPHPGNLLVSDGRLVLIDFGLVAEIDRSSMEWMALAAVHLISADYDTLFDDLVELGLLARDADRQQVLPPLQRVLEQGMRAGANIRRRAKNFKAISDDLNTVFYELPFQVPDYFALITRALAVLEGIALVGDPEFDIFWASYPYALSKAHALLGTRRTAGLLSAAAARAAQHLTAEERVRFVHNKHKTESGGAVAVPATQLAVA